MTRSVIPFDYMPEVGREKGFRSQGGSLKSPTSLVPRNLGNRELHPTRAGRSKPLHCTNGEYETWRCWVQKRKCQKLKF